MSGAQSGVGVNEECGAKFLELKRKNKFKFITFKIDDSGKTIVLDKDGPPNVRSLFRGAAPIGQHDATPCIAAESLWRRRPLPIY